jgi:hypothetical protein
MPPEFLTKYRPDLVIAMNPNYVREISSGLDALGCSNATLLSLGADLPEAIAGALAGPGTSWASAPPAAR